MARIAFCDANVLYPAELRSFLMHLALAGLFRPKWSAEVHEEWIGNLLKNRPDLTREKLNRTRHLMDEAMPDADVRDYGPRMNDLGLPDPNDRHVLAAAIHSEAGVIVTNNLKDFPASALQPHGVEVLTPDDFILELFDSSPELVAEAAEAHRSSLKNPATALEEYLNTLERQGLSQTVSALRGYLCDQR